MSARRAMTLLELLAVIGIVGLLFALVLSAVMKARDTAYRSACQNNLRQIGVALESYHDQTGLYPPGVVGFQGDYPFMAWSARILPQIEQASLFQDAMADYARQKFPFDDPVHQTLAHVLRLYVCPGDGRETAIVPPLNFTAATSSYLGVSGTSFNQGILYYNSKTRKSDVTDGLANTALLGERPPGPDEAGVQQRYGWWYAGVGTDFHGTGDSVLPVRAMNESFRHPTCPKGPYRFRPGSPREPCDVFHYWSVHSGGGNFLFADGHVVFLEYSADANLPAFSTRAGGETVDTP